MSLTRCVPPPPLARRTLVRRVLLGAFWLPFAGALTAVVRRTGVGRPPRQVAVVPNYRDGFAFAGDVVVHGGPEIPPSAFSTRCTHLGCRIGRADDGQLVCPCHGSRFHADGTVAVGPASTPLQALHVTADPSTGTLIVDV